MYKILITTTYYAGYSDGGVAVHTIVVEFASPPEANIAINAINSNNSQMNRCNQHAIALF